MSDLFRRLSVIFVAALVGSGAALPTVAQTQGAQTQNDPPGRVGRLAFTQGTVSFHNSEDNAWTPAAINTPLTSGDAIWTEPNARSEISLAGTRVRLEGQTQLGMLAVDDSQTRLQLDQGKIDIKTFAFDRDHPYEIATPRGTVQVLEQGDYYVEAGSTDAPTRLGVRAGAAQIQAMNGQVLAVRAGQVGEALGDPASPQLRIVENTPPPAPPAYWAARDRQVVYDRPPEYLPVGMTGYEDLGAYGDWVNDGSYGQVWVPRSTPAGWAPYRNGRWVHHPPYGWTWVDEQPWGFAPYHYGRWANTGGRWAWVPPQRNVRPAYAPALVGFVGGAALGAALTTRHASPVGWFPLGPREAYVPPYTANRNYYERLNRADRVEDAILREHWERVGRREGFQAGVQAGQHRALVNQRFATVVPANTFARSEPVSRAVLKVDPDKIRNVEVARVAAPIAPGDGDRDAGRDARGGDPRGDQRGDRPAVAKTPFGDMQTLARPADNDRRTDQRDQRAAPGPQIAAPRAGTDDKDRRALPPLAPRQGDEQRQQARPAEPRGQPGQQPGQQPGKPDDQTRQQQREQQQRQEQQRDQQAKPAEPPRQPQAAPQQQRDQQTRPAEPQPQAPQQQRQEQQREQQTRPAEPPRQPQQQQQQQQQREQQTRPAEPPRQPQAAPQQQQQQRPAPQPQAAPQQQPRPQQQPQAAPQQPRPQPQPQQQQQMRPPQQQQVPQQAQQPPQQRPQQAPQPQQQQQQQPQQQQQQQQKTNN